ncbi:MAG: ATP-binding cassette domain-containing protein [Alphaproteobacteria bacterium]|nr:ATP-binding cassette domain-containing protein [Alphaproteobacteria bacterium]
MLQAKNVFKTIKGNEILKDINLQIEPGKITCLIGPSGSGKSTILNCLSLLSNPTKGTVSIDDTIYTFNENTKPNNNFSIYPKITVVFQSLFLFPHLTNQENILLPLNEQKLMLPNEYDDLISQLKIKHILNKFPEQCSGGERQRVALLRQILLKPKYLLLDEVTSALDLETVSIIADILIKLKKRNTGILLITHMINFAIAVSDNFYFLDKGEIIENGEIDKIKPNIKYDNKPDTERLRTFLNLS